MVSQADSKPKNTVLWIILGPVEDGSKGNDLSTFVCIWAIPYGRRNDKGESWQRQRES